MFHISQGSYIINIAWLNQQCEVIRKLVNSETIGAKPIKLVFFIQLVCSFISIACSSHYFCRQHH
jgi:hypothetical protein